MKKNEKKRRKMRFTVQFWVMRAKFQLLVSCKRRNVFKRKIAIKGARLQGYRFLFQFNVTGVTLFAKFFPLSKISTLLGDLRQLKDVTSYSFPLSFVLFSSSPPSFSSVIYILPLCRSEHLLLYTFLLFHIINSN